MINSTANSDWKNYILLLKEIAIIKYGKGWQKKLAEQTKFKESNISRMFSLKYSPRFSNLIVLTNALNIQLNYKDLDSAKTALEKAMENQKK
ncbi:helix-turn-helix domain-containing protein [Tenacibaculum dicentrarchi]|nr:helix-turn-helix domain-containing protein [Tenacibaculum dicentrarchi]